MASSADTESQGKWIDVADTTHTSIGHAESKTHARCDLGYVGGRAGDRSGGKTAARPGDE